MAEIGLGISRLLIDQSGDPITDDTANALKVKLVDSIDSIDIGDVSLLLGGTAADTGLGVYGAQTLRVTLASNDVLTTLMRVDLATIAGNTTTISTNTSPTGDILGDPISSTHSGTRVLASRNDELAPLVNVIDGDYTFFQVNALGALYTTGGEVENAAVQSEPLLIGGRYDSSARTLGSGDAGAVALNASGHVIMDIVDGGQLDTIVDTLETTLTAIETDQAAIEALLTTIDVDTGSAAGGITTIKNATYADDADWTDDSSRHMLVGGLYQSSMQSITDGDVGPFQVDVNGQLKVAVDVITGGADGVTTVSSAGTDVVLGGDVACKKIDIQAQTDNTGLIAVGFTGVDATEATGTGVIFYAGDTYSLEMVNLNLIYIDSTVSGEGVRYTYFT